MWTLILFMYASTFSGGDSVSLTNVSNFSSYELCEKAGKLSVMEFETFMKSGKFVCVKVESN